MSIVIASSSETQFSLNSLEAASVAIAIGACFAWPRLGSKWFSYLEHLFLRLARRPGLSVAVVGFSVILLRLAILPIHPVPVPFGADDFSNLLAADTFSHGRLTNPTPAMWVHFETIHIDMRPTYMSMYFPAQGLVLSAGKVLFGHPWFGVLAGGALMCASICWMLQAWLPPSWALLGGFLAVLRLALFSYWTSTYHNAGPISAFGGALVLGGLPRLMRKPRVRHALMMSAGAAILLISRPYEGLLLCLPVLVVLSHWMISSKDRPAAPVLFRSLAPGLALLIAALAWMGYYDNRVFGHPLTLPYTVNRTTYALAPYYVWQKLRPEPAYRHEEMRRFYHVEELNDYYKIHKPFGFLKSTLIKAARAVFFFSGLVLLPPLFMLPWALRDRRIRFLVYCLLVLAAGMAIEIYLFPHYVAAFTAAFYAVGLQSMRHLRVWRPGGQSSGLALTRCIVAICVLMAVVRLFDRQLNCPVPERPVSTWICNWFGPDHFVTQRSLIEHQLQQIPGDQLAIVRYSPTHDPIDEWVFNAADIDESKVIWAREMNADANRELIQYYGNRRVWLVQPDQEPAITPYPMPGQVTSVSRESVAWSRM